MPPSRPSRKKACTQCRIAKARCCLTLPKCARCQKKDFICQYQSVPFDRSDSSGKGPELAQADEDLELSRRRLGLTEDLEISFTNGQSNHVIPRQHSDHSDVAWELKHSQVDDMTNSAPPHTNMPMTEYTDRQPFGFLTSMDVDQEIMPISSERNSEQINFFGRIHNKWQAQNPAAAKHASRDLDFQPPLRPSLVQQYPGFLAPKPLVSMRSWLTARIVIGCISSYPYMLQGSSSLPPFIHSHFAHDDVKLDCPHQHGKPDLPPALKNCASIVKIYKETSGENRTFAERTMSFEQQRLFDECYNYGRWEVLYALQACTIYLILIAFPSGENQKPCDRPSDYPPMAPALVSTISCLISLHHSHDRESSQDLLNFHAQASWHDWIWEESAKRVTGLLFTIGLLVELSTGCKMNPACQGFGAVCLPAAESLWEAPTISDWEESLRISRTTRRSNVTLTVANLEDTICWKKEKASGAISTDLGNWCEAADRFGRLVVMAVMMRSD